jgi:hypothetical protein
VNERAASEAGKGLVDRQFKRLRVAEEESEGHGLIRCFAGQIVAAPTLGF